MLTFNIDGAIARVDGMLARMANMQPVMAQIGDEQASRIMLRIVQTKQDPDGNAWDAWKPSTQAHREAKGNAGQGLLWDEGTLLHSVTMAANPFGVTIGESTSYAGYLQDGTPNMAARPSVGWGAEDKVLAEHQVVRYLEGINL
jgi:phage gpG-like protein